MMLFTLLCGFYLGSMLPSNGVFLKLPFIETKGEASSMPIWELQKTASNNLATIDQRAQAIYSLFSSYMYVGIEKRDFNTILPGSNWVENSKIIKIDTYGGKPEVNCQNGCGHFQIQLFQKIQPNWWNIHVCLEGCVDESEAANFFKGAGDHDTIKLKNYVLQYPPLHAKGFGRKEHYYWWGQFVERPRF